MEVQTRGRPVLLRRGVEDGGELVDRGTPTEAACRIVTLKDRLEEAQRLNAEYRRAATSANPTAAA